MELIRKETDNINKFLFFEGERILGQLFILLNQHLLGANNGSDKVVIKLDVVLKVGHIKSRVLSILNDDQVGLYDLLAQRLYNATLLS